jgi:hypothetical protein
MVQTWEQYQFVCETIQRMMVRLGVDFSSPQLAPALETTEDENVDSSQAPQVEAPPAVVSVPELQIPPVEEAKAPEVEVSNDNQSESQLTGALDAILDELDADSGAMPSPRRTADGKRDSAKIDGLLDEMFQAAEEFDMGRVRNLEEEAAQPSDSTTDKSPQLQSEVPGEPISVSTQGVNGVEPSSPAAETQPAPKEAIEQAKPAAESSWTRPQTSKSDAPNNNVGGVSEHRASSPSPPPVEEPAQPPAEPKKDEVSTAAAVGSTAQKQAWSARRPSIVQGTFQPEKAPEVRVRPSGVPHARKYQALVDKRREAESRGNKALADMLTSQIEALDRISAAGAADVQVESPRTDAPTPSAAVNEPSTEPASAYQPPDVHKYQAVLSALQAKKDREVVDDDEAFSLKLDTQGSFARLPGLSSGSVSLSGSLQKEKGNDDPLAKARAELATLRSRLEFVEKDISSYEEKIPRYEQELADARATHEAEKVRTANMSLQMVNVQFQRRAVDREKLERGIKQQEYIIKVQSTLQRRSKPAQPRNEAIVGKDKFARAIAELERRKKAAVGERNFAVAADIASKIAMLKHKWLTLHGTPIDS